MTWTRAVELAEREFGRLDILVNNAAILGRPGIMETSLELWNEVVAVNQTGPFLGMRAAILALRRAGGGSIVNISSALAIVGYGESVSYTAAKGALTALTWTVAVEAAPEGIRVNVVHPGVIDTPMVDDGVGRSPEALRAQAASAPLGRIGRAEEMAAAVLFLVSDESSASFVTGASLSVDGGSSVCRRAASGPNQRARRAPRRSTTRIRTAFLHDGQRRAARVRALELDVGLGRAEAHPDFISSASLLELALDLVQGDVRPLGALAGADLLVDREALGGHESRDRRGSRAGARRTRCSTRPSLQTPSGRRLKTIWMRSRFVMRPRRRSAGRRAGCRRAGSRRACARPR